jgi:hypothetical protein
MNEALAFNQRAEAILDRAWNTAMASQSQGEANICDALLIDLIFNSTEIGYKKAIIIQVAVTQPRSFCHSFGESVRL